MSPPRPPSESKEEKLEPSRLGTLVALLDDVAQILSELDYYESNPKDLPLLFPHPYLLDYALLNPAGLSKLLQLNQTITEAEKKTLSSLLTSGFNSILRNKKTLTEYLLHVVHDYDFLKKKPDTFSYGSLLKIVREETILGVILATHQDPKKQKKGDETSTIKHCKKRMKDHFNHYKKPTPALIIQSKTEGNATIDVNTDPLDSPKMNRR